MPCTLTKVYFKVGDAVKKGDTLLIMEAMKMEHTIKANKDGVVLELHFKEGDFVEPGKSIMKIE
jgi:3-methylcrotonyl-CoA carboxylase alpha subunit